MMNQTVLLVEDNDDDAELTIMAFKEARILNPVIRVRSGEEALDYIFCRGQHAGKTHSLPAMILLDIKLPRLNGLEVLQEIRNDPRTKHLPVVILTSSAEESDRITAYTNFANSYVQKPVDYDQFVKAARQLGLYWTMLNLPPPVKPIC